MIKVNFHYWLLQVFEEGQTDAWKRR